MPNETLLGTFVHISDLHLGDLDPNNDATLTAEAKDWWQWYGAIFDGYLGHHGNALRHLEIAFGDLQDGENAIVLVTGDLTAVGSSSQFNLALQYLQDYLPLNTGESVGLGQAQVLEWTIPGNHDHWPGRTASGPGDLVMLGESKGTFQTIFKKLPITLRRIPLRAGCELVIAGIDTDADVGPKSITRFFARGRFVSQLKTLEEMLGPPRSNEIRVLLLHHSPQSQTLKLGIADDSRVALRHFIERYEISVLLTGHFHVPAGEVNRISYRGVTWDVLEARCGTTTQRDEFPLDWPDRQLPPNTLLVHRLIDVDQKHIEWRTNLFVRKLRGFADTGALRLKGRAKGKESLIVWPR